MKRIYTLHSDAEGASPPFEQFHDLKRALDRRDEIIDEFRSVWEPGHTVDWRIVEPGDQAMTLNVNSPYRLFQRTVLHVVDSSGFIQMSVTLRLYEFDVQDEVRAGQEPLILDDLPTEPGYYKVTYTWGGLQEPSGYELCEVFEGHRGELMANSMLFETLYPTQGDEIPRNHITHPLEELDMPRQKLSADIETPEDNKPLGVRLQWQRLVPAHGSKQKEGDA
jgi:hypothetical protein